jgi:tetratricopeptide (TPR) repeat protein
MAAIAAMGEQHADVAQRELQAAQKLSESHPNLLIAKGVVLDAEARLAGARGDIAGKTAIIRKGLALREQLGDERDVVVSLNNLADALRLQHRFVEALEVGARANKRARANQYAELEFDTGFNLLDALVFMGLDEQAIAGGGPVLELARQFGFSDLWQMRTMQTTGFAQMDKGDAAAALSTLRAADAKVPLQNLSFALAVIGQSYEAYAAFAAAPTEVAGIEARLDALFKPRQGSSDYRAWAFEMPMVRALSLAAADKPREAEKALQSALLQAHDANADPAPIRTAAMLISATNNDAAIAAIGLGNFDAATETDALRLRLIAEWASRNGDAKTAAAATASAAATARLTALRKQGEAALVAAGLDPDDPLGGPSVAHATDVVRSAN